MKTAIATLSVPIIAVLFIVGMFISSHAAAQTPSRLMFANHLNSEDTLTGSHESGYIAFAAGAGGVQATLSATEPENASPYFKTFRVTRGALTPGLNPVVLGTDTGFWVRHGSTYLTETIDYYWNTFVGFGYTGMMKAFTPGSMEYLFDNGERQYRAVFTTVGDDIDVSFTPVARLIASR